ncbi:unnamed protein product [Leuciscus chuanchicus]
MNRTLLTSQTPPLLGTSTKPVSGTKGGNVTLTCESEDREITHISLFHQADEIPVCETEECKSENSRVFKEGSCDIIIKDLKLSDAGKYILRVYYTNDQSKLEPQITEYHLHIHDEISVKKGEKVKLDVLLINADKVERNSSEGWTEVWTRGHGVNSDRLTVSDETLIINEFTVTDTGTYRVLDYEGETLITVSVTESGSTGEHKGIKEIVELIRFRWLNLLLLFSIIKYRETTTVGNISIHVTGQKGENATLPCDIEARDIFHVILTSQSKNIPVCENEECESGRAFKKGSCHIIIKDLIFSDAGKYILRVHYTNTPEPQIRTYHLQIHDDISVKKGAKVKLDVLLINADKVERNSSEGWTEVWTRGHGVNSDRLNDHDGNLTINEFTANDTGTYIVKDSEGETLITVTVTESRTDSGSPGERKDDTEHTAVYWFWSVGLPVILLVLVGVIVFFVNKKHQCLNRLYSLPPDQNAGL